MAATGAKSSILDTHQGLWAAVALVILAWAVLYLPAIEARSFYFEEGRRAAQAQAMLETGELMKTEVFGERYIYKPPMVPWLVAATALVRGGQLDEWSVRLPAAFMTLATTLLAFAMANGHSGRMAGLVAAAGVLLSVHTLQKGVLGETDTTITATQFAAFFLWWRNLQNGGPGIGTWIGCGLLLAIAMLAKGPVGAAYFCSTVLVLHVWRREWNQIAGLLFAVAIAAAPLLYWTWQVYEPGSLVEWQGQLRMRDVTVPYLDGLSKQLWGASQIVVEHAPWLLVAMSGLLPSRRNLPALNTPLVGALIVYTLLFSIILIVWPYTLGRYAMPATPALAVLAGIVVANVWGPNRWADRGFICLVAGLALYQIATTWFAPYLLDNKRYASRLAGQEITRVTSDDNAPIYVPSPYVYSNMLIYVGQRVQVIRADGIADIEGPAWILVPKEREMEIRQKLPQLGETPATTVTSNQETYLVYRLPAG